MKLALTILSVLVLLTLAFFSPWIYSYFYSEEEWISLWTGYKILISVVIGIVTAVIIAYYLLQREWSKYHETSSSK